jgi:DNA (cytosine-5)-methyltransferase 1
VRSIAAVDLFCGAGGLTHGLIQAKIPVLAGIDIDPACRYPYEINNVGATFVEQDIALTTAEDVRQLFGNANIKILVGCAPCQAFSSYNQARFKDNRWKLVDKFAELIRELEPDIVTMENVPRLKRHSVYSEFVKILRDCGFHVHDELVDCRRVGVPQRRTRLVVLASKFGPLSLDYPRKQDIGECTVRSAIYGLPELEAGEGDANDIIHRTSRLSELNLRRIKASKPGGYWRDWPEELKLPCHKKASGKSFLSVYGRMEWSAPAPTITTQCNGLGNGRFGHPQQHRAISLREAALLQSFPKTYKFVRNKEEFSFTLLARMIGNAVPVNLGKAIGHSIVRHLESL